MCDSCLAKTCRKRNARAISFSAFEHRRTTYIYTSLKNLRRTNERIFQEIAGSTHIRAYKYSRKRTLVGEIRQEHHEHEQQRVSSPISKEPEKLKFPNKKDRKK